MVKEQAFGRWKTHKASFGETDGLKMTHLVKPLVVHPLLC